MQAIVVTRVGGPEVLELRELPVPRPKPREVLIRVAAAGVNRADLLLQMQVAAPPAGWSNVPGLEVSGVVAATGRAVRDFAVGDRVAALCLSGGYADYCLADERLVIPWPAALTAEQACGVPEAVATVWTSLIERGRPKLGERVLVNGGASVIGALAIAVAASRGCQVVATAGSSEKCAAAKRAGAAAAINYRDADCEEQLRAATGGQGVDLVLDLAGGATVERNIRLLRPKGRLVMIGVMAGRAAALDIFPLMAKRASILGSTLFFRTLPEKGLALRRGWSLLEPLLAHDSDALLYVDRTFPLAAASDAQRRMDEPAHRGKVALQPQGAATA
jgi:putative PIG3 family NAD(P)H quinone oxidoreductase